MRDTASSVTSVLRMAVTLRGPSYMLPTPFLFIRK